MLTQLWQGYETDWGYMTEQQLVESAVVENELLINPPFFYPRGKVLGGSTATNAMIYM